MSQPDTSGERMPLEWRPIGKFQVAFGAVGMLIAARNWPTERTEKRRERATGNVLVDGLSAERAKVIGDSWSTTIGIACQVRAVFLLPGSFSMYALPHTSGMRERIHGVRHRIHEAKDQVN